MSQASRRHLRLESIDGVTVVSFVDTKIVTEENIQEVGDQLYSLVEDEGHRQLLLNFGNVQYLSSAALGKLINLKKKVGAVKGKLKLCDGGEDDREKKAIGEQGTPFYEDSNGRPAVVRRAVWPPLTPRPSLPQGERGSQTASCSPLSPSCSPLSPCGRGGLGG